MHTLDSATGGVRRVFYLRVIIVLVGLGVYLVVSQTILGVDKNYYIPYAATPLEDMPVFVNSIFPNNRDTVSDTNGFCFSIHPVYVWEPGLIDIDVSEYIISSIEINLDGRLININTFSIEMATSQHGIWDYENNLVDSVGGILHFCSPKSPLSIGEHTVNVNIPTLSGQRRDFGWSFEVEE